MDSSFPHLNLNLLWKMEGEVCKAREARTCSSPVSEVASNCVQFISTSQIKHSITADILHSTGVVGSNTLFSLPPSVT